MKRGEIVLLSEEQTSEERVARPDEVLEDMEYRADETKPEALRCSAGRATENGCPREATTWAFPESDNRYPLCDEHHRVHELASEVQYWETAESVVEDWLRLARAWQHHDLERLAENAHEDAKEKSLKAQARCDLAEEIADAPRKGDERPNLTREQDEKVRNLIARDDALRTAYTTVQDAPEDHIADDVRRRTLGVLVQEAERSSEEVRRYREEIGLTEPK